MPMDSDEEKFVNEITNACQKKANMLAIAQYYYKKYIALVEVGFTEFQALEIIKARGIGL